MFSSLPINLFKPKKPTLQITPTAKIVSQNKKLYNIEHAINNLTFLHIGKCGGTSIMHSFLNNKHLIKQIHIKEYSIEKGQYYFTWVRNPIARFVSAFNHSKSIIQFDVTGLKEEDLTIENCPAPVRLQLKIRNGHCFNPHYEKLCTEFNSANELAEALSSHNSELKAKAWDLVTASEEHLHRGISWYLKNVESLFHSNKLIFVGRLEYMEHDYTKLLNQLNLNTTFHSKNALHLRERTEAFEKQLSQRAVNNIINAYSDDYKTLKNLQKRRLIPKSTLEEYYHYSKTI